MFNISAVIRVDKVVRSLDNIEDVLPQTANAEIEKTLDDIEVELAKPGLAVTYPVNWDSERQRRAYFASDGFGHGIPYQRTGAYEEGYYHKSVGSMYNRTHTLYHNSATSIYIGGNDRGKRKSRIHAGRWPLAATIIKRHVSLLFSALDKKVRAALQREGLN